MERYRFDYVFFTGSPSVGKTLGVAAAKKLIPFTLELGGKSPAIVDRKADLNIAAKRLAWGKFFNAGQTCVSPDYLLIHEDIKNEFISKVKKNLISFYGKNPVDSKFYTHIVNDNRFKILTGYLKQGKIIHGGTTDKKKRYIEPTILENVNLKATVMQEEIFGPILPVITYKKITEAIEIIQNNPHPLALYLFTEDSAIYSKIISEITFGGGAINNTLVHLINPELPFGGVGNSGIGQYHGKYSFDTFSHSKGMLISKTFYDNSLRYPPVTTLKMILAKWLFK